jgi:hypothetical protein
MKKALKITIWTASIAVAAILLLFAAFLVSENSQPTGQAIGSQQGNQTQASEPQNNPIPEQCAFRLEEPNVSGHFSWNNISWTTKEEGNSTTYNAVLTFAERNDLPSVKTDYILRNNPFKIENISSNITRMPGKITYVSYDSSMAKCNNTMLSAIQTGYFLGLLGINATGAVTSAEGNNTVEVKTCKDANENATVIVIQSTETCAPKITENGNCIVLDMGRCYPVETSEKLILDFIKIGMAQGTIKAE